MSSLNDPELARYLSDPRIVRFCEYCKAYFADPTECFATYNKVEYFYHVLVSLRCNSLNMSLRLWEIMF